jgi:cell division protein FtsQ
MIKPVKFLFFLILLTILTTYTPPYKSEHKSLFFPIENILIENNKIIKSNEIEKKINFIYGKNLLFINQENIKNNLEGIEFISSFQIKKVYPKTIKILIKEKKPIAIHIKKGKKYFFTADEDVINFQVLEAYLNLPHIFGKDANFYNLYKDLKKVTFSLNEVKSFHYYEIGRWDITLKKNITIKLPKNNYLESLKNFQKIKNNNEFDNYKIFDYRIKDQLILN